MNKKTRMQQLEQEILCCKKCDLHKSRKQAIPGSGNIYAKILFIGEAPGTQEDEQGKPFVGRSGKILDQLLESVYLQRKHLYITNILKCHPSKNHSPSKKEIASCLPYLYRQLILLQPNIIVTLGKYASQASFSLFHLPFTAISTEHGKRHKVQTPFPTNIIAFYHPAAACHHPNILKTLKKDFLKVFLSK